MDCARHPQRVAIAACAECGDLVCVDCRRVSEDGLGVCAECAGEEVVETQAAQAPESADPLISVDRGAEVAALEPERAPEAVVVVEPAPETPDTVEVSGVTPVPWEHPEAYGDIAAFRATVTLALFGPMRFMSRVPWRRDDLRTPLVFAILCGVVGYLGLTLGGALVETPSLGPTRALPGLEGLPPTVTRLLMMPLLPLTIATALFLQAALAHFLLSMVGATRRPFEATFRVFCYASAASVFVAVPVVGPHVDIMFTVLLVLSGMRAAHETTFATGLLALAPLMVAQLVAPLN